MSNTLAEVSAVITKAAESAIEWPSGWTNPPPIDAVILNFEDINLTSLMSVLDEVTIAITKWAIERAEPQRLMCGGCLDRQLRDGTEPKPAITVAPMIGAACEEHLAYALKRWGTDRDYSLMVER